MNRNFLIAMLAVLVVVCTYAVSSAKQDPKAPTASAFAVAVVVPAEASTVSGRVWFSQTSEGVTVEGSITGLEPKSIHGFHIHEFGDITSKDGMSLGGHFNPQKSQHGLPEMDKTHAGDMGNIVADDKGTATFTRVFKGMSITGDQSVLGRGIVVHAKPDDGGQPTGNAGGRSAFGVIGFAKEKL